MCILLLYKCESAVKCYFLHFCQQKLIGCSFLRVQVWDKAAAAFKSEKDVVVAKVDADAHKDLGERYG